MGFDDLPVPISGLIIQWHFIVFSLIALIGAILATIIFPRIFCPIFLKLKHLIMKSYKDGFIPNKTTKVIKKFLIRSINIALLTLGLLAFILPQIDPTDWVRGGQAGVDYYVNLGVPAHYIQILLVSVTMLIVPISVGLWSIGWMLEDAGLMHYSLEEKLDKNLYEIEPIYVKYSSYLKGFAGISTIFFLYQAISAWTSITSESRALDAFVVAIIPLFCIILSIPAYLVHLKLSLKSTFLVKNLPQIRKIKENELKIEK